MPHDPYKALYLHLPFCVKRCAYCDFATAAVPAGSPEIDAYVEDLSLQIRRKAKEGELGALETVYLGGGTPSHVGLSGLSMLLYTLSLSMHLTPEVECTMEANPESLTERMVRDIWALGVNRLSIGVQSFDDEVLRTLGRAHSSDDARRAVEAARTRFDNVSLDLMCGIPGQSAASFEAGVREAARLAACLDFIEALPDGFDTVVGEGGCTLSGGEKQRISIARALLKDAPIVVLDEATASVDPENEQLIQQAIGQLTAGKTVVVIAHRLATIENADQILVIDGGTVAQRGTHDQLMAEGGTFRRFVEIRRRAEGWRIASDDAVAPAPAEDAPMPAAS